MIIEDEPADAEIIARVIGQEFKEVDIVEILGEDEFDRAVKFGDFDVALTDFHLQWSTGLVVARALKKAYPEKPVLMVTETGGEEAAAEGIRVGLDDYILKRDLSRLPPAVRAALSRAALVRENREAVAKLKCSEERYRAISEMTSDFAFAYIVTEDGVMTREWMTSAYTEITGYEPDGPESETLPPTFIHPEDVSTLADIFIALAAGEEVAGEQRIITKAGEIKWMRFLLKPIWDIGEGRLIRLLGAAQDITRRKEAEERVVYLAFHDGLTNLPNRRLFEERLAQSLTAAARGDFKPEVLMFNIDRFKKVNEVLGREAADRVLLGVAERLKGCAAKGETVARLGADEFAVTVMNGSAHKHSAHMVRAFLDELKKPFNIGGREIVVSASAGVSQYPGDGKTPGDLLAHADQALSRAKEGGRDSFQFFTPELNIEVDGVLRLEADLRRAVEEGDMTPFYQPVVDLRTGKIVGTEALARWRRTGNDFVGPDQFIPLLEDMGLIHTMGEKIMRDACAQTRLWNDAGFGPLNVSVNLSPQQVWSERCAETVAAVLGETGLEPGLLELELTEGNIMADLKHASIAMYELKELGVRLAIDDFGTGFSSLSSLKMFPIDVLKIDRSFVRDVIDNADDRAIIKAIIAMAEALKLEVVAEGVETDQQLKWLRDQNAHAMQGFLFSRPLAAKECETLIKARKFPKLT